MEDNKKMSAFAAFAQVQETFKEAEEKAKSEESKSFAKVPNFLMKKDGEYKVRILPNAPVLDDEGNPKPLDRKSYEYPVNSIFLNIKNPKDGKKITFPVTKATMCGMSVDLIDTFVEIVKTKYASDEKIVEKVKSNSFSGGLKYNSDRAMFVIDLADDKAGIQLLSLSYSQYKDLETIKMAAWKEMRDDDENVGCPVSSINDGYPVSIIRGNDNGKTYYKFTLGRKQSKIPEETLVELLDLPRLPELLYRYTRYQFEATIEYLKQYEEALQISVMEEEAIKEAIEKINIELPSDDKSHFSFDKKKGDNKGGDDDIKTLTFDDLLDQYDDIVAKKLGESSEEYGALRADIAQFIDDNDLSIRITRKKNNADLLDEIEEVLNESVGATEKEDAPIEAEKEEVAQEEAVTTQTEKAPEETEEKAPRGERNDDTNEPAVHAERTTRAARERVRR